jgi:hypothetical protein
VFSSVRFGLTKKFEQRFTKLNIRAEWYCNEAEKTENEDEKARLSRKSKKMIFHCLR